MSAVISTPQTQRTTHLTLSSPDLASWIAAFLRSRQSSNFADTTVTWYRNKLAYLYKYLNQEHVREVERITPDQLRAWLIRLAEDGHNAGGVHGAYRAARAFFHWWELETDLDPRQDPIRKVRAPKVPEVILDPIDEGDLVALIHTCHKASEQGIRDAAILMTLYDTGSRADELIHLNLEDVDLSYGMADIKHGKADKPRPVFLGKRSCRAIRAYLRFRGQEPGPLFITRYNDRFKYSGLRGLIERRAAMAGLEPPMLHSFRRGFTDCCKRAHLADSEKEELLGHEWKIGSLRNYLKYSVSELKEFHNRARPVDGLPL